MLAFFSKRTRCVQDNELCLQKSEQIWTEFRSIDLLLNDWRVAFLISEIDLPLQLATVRLEQLQEVLLLQLPFYLLCLQLHWLGTEDGSHKIISLMFLVS